MAYSKLHSSIINSSLWIAPDATRLLFITLLALCDADGAVYGSKYGLARLANIKPDEIDEAWNDLMSHDPDSSDRMRAPEHNGRRVEEISGGYRLLNFSYYRGLRNDDDRREQNRQAQERFRSKNSKPASATISPVQPASAAVSQRQPLKAQAEAEEEAEKNNRSTGVLPGDVSPDPSQPPSTGVASGKPARKRASKPASESNSAAWSAYEQAYSERYGAIPVRNAKVNGQIARFVERLGGEEAPGVASAYLANRNSLYVSAKHCVDLMLRDAEKLRTEWATGKVVHQREAKEEDRLSATGAMWKQVGQELNEKGIK